MYHRYPPSTKAEEEVRPNWREARNRWLPIAAAIVDRVMAKVTLIRFLPLSLR